MLILKKQRDSTNSPVNGLALHSECNSKTTAEDVGLTHDPELTVTPSTTEPARSAAAERMRLHRERRRQGLRCLTIELRETEIDALVRMKLLRGEMRNDPSAVSKALYAYFDRALGVTP